jgi:hypothetical protein
MKMNLNYYVWMDSDLSIKEYKKGPDESLTLKETEEQATFL